MKPLVFIALPTHDGRMQFGTADASLRYLNWGTLAQVWGDDPPFDVRMEVHATSDLCRTFNLLWCAALNVGATHFAMLHDDLVPHPNWLIRLWTTMQAHGAACVSAVSPIKDIRGLTSTAVGGADPHDGTEDWRWEVVKQVTLEDLRSLPDVFSASDLGFAHHPLLVNTGCMLLDIKQITQKIPDFRFDMVHGLHCDAAGVWRIRNDRTEDWELSRDLYRVGLVALAHQGIQIKHYGGKVYEAGR